MWQQYQTIGEIFFRFHTKLRWKKQQVLLCRANAWIGTHVMFPVIPKRCCCFSVVQSFQFEFTTHLKYYRANICDQLIENTTIMSWHYIICIKRCFLHTNQWLLLHVLAVYKRSDEIIRYTDVCFWRSFFGAFSVCDDCTLKSSTAWLLKLSVLYIHSFMQVHNTTFEIKTVFNSVLFSTEVHNPLHVHLLALRYIYIYAHHRRGKMWKCCFTACDCGCCG